MSATLNMHCRSQGRFPSSSLQHPQPPHTYVHTCRCSPLIPRPRVWKERIPGHAVLEPGPFPQLLKSTLHHLAMCPCFLPLTEVLRERFPGHAVLEPGPFPQPPRKGKAPKSGAQKNQQQHAQGAGEEGTEEGPEGDEKVQQQYLWCVSPLDGVGNYEHLYPFFAGGGEGVRKEGRGAKGTAHAMCGGGCVFGRCRGSSMEE